MTVVDGDEIVVDGEKSELGDSASLGAVYICRRGESQRMRTSGMQGEKHILSRG